MFGYRAADLLGTPLDRLIPVESRGQHRQQVERFRDSQASSRMMGARSAVRGLRALAPRASPAPAKNTRAPL